MGKFPEQGLEYCSLVGAYLNSNLSTITQFKLSYRNKVKTVMEARAMAGCGKKKKGK